MGHPAHTTHDLSCWMPERRVLFTGDLVFNGGTPFVVMGSVRRVRSTRSSVAAAFEATTIVPGHGAVCGPELIDGRLPALRPRLAGAAHRGRAAPLDVARQTDLGSFAELPDPRTHRRQPAPRLRRDARGAVLARRSICRRFGDMVAFNGGRPLRCLA